MYLNMDVKNDLLSKLVWIVLASLRAIWSFAYSVSRRKNICTEELFPDIEMISCEKSISRSISEEKLSSVLVDLKNKNIKPVVTDFGSGNARYYSVFEDIFGVGNFEYNAIEHPNFKFLDDLNGKPFLNLYNCDLNAELPSCVKESNVFLSFSVLEHLKDPVGFMERYIAVSPFRSFHFHQYPRFSSIFNYLWHGCGHINTLEDVKFKEIYSNKMMHSLFFRLSGFFLIVEYLFSILPGYFIPQGIYRWYYKLLNIRLLSMLLIKFEIFFGVFFPSFTILYSNNLT